MLHFLRHIVFVIGVFQLTSSAMASTYIPLDDSVYDILLRLEAEGVIRSGLLTTRPISRREVIRLLLEAERNSGDRGFFVQELIKSLKERFQAEIRDIKFLKPIDVVYIRYLYSDSNVQELYYNDDGDIYEKGLNLRSGLLSRAELGWVSFFLNPEFRYSDKDTDTIMKRAYSVLSFSGLELEAGQDSQWWGPGYHGAILLSNNAEPFRMIKLTNQHPVLLPWIFKFLGPFKAAFFVTRLTENRAVPEPYLWGMRFNFKPIPYIEIGLQSTAFLGGDGYPEDPDTWWRSFTGNDDNESGAESDRKTGFDVKLTLPVKWQPFQVYLEAAGEDERGGLPSNWAYLAGLYLPRVYYFERVDFRAEYAENRISGQPGYWYNHHIYRSGYSYKGRIIGHHMGSDSNDMFLEMNYRLPEIDGRIKVSYDIEEHNLSGSPKPVKTETSLGLEFGLKNNVSLKAEFTTGELKNTDDSNEKIDLFMLNLDYYF